MTLTVTGVASAHALWTTSSGTHVDTLGSDDGTTSAGSSYSICASGGRSITGISMSNPAVAEGDIASITSVRFLGTGRSPGRGASGADLTISFATPSGFSEVLNFFNNANYEVEYGTTRTAQPDSSAWEYSDIEGLEFNIVSGSASIHLAYFAAEVVYVEAVADNATFFGTNF
tara:strand:+ start:237 stop:755 length:519 start_codon:yes stop_codon:yes gene_type:complete